jgi:hypothetical protein
MNEVKEEVIYTINTQLDFSVNSFRTLKKFYPFLSLSTLHRLFHYEVEHLKMEFLLALLRQLDQCTQRVSRLSMTQQGLVISLNYTVYV